MQYMWRLAGLFFVALAMLGIPLPLLPTVPFLLLAAFCFSRGSDRLHTWLVTHPVLGPPIRDWNDRGAIPAKGKRLATVSVIAVFSLSLMLGLATYLLVIQFVALACVMIFIWSRPSH